ncbi:PAS domain S-box-containing protein [Haladaptatus litoreus]|uniref:PAS domain S-box-containing protein n=1 Tax=Haladaptatus litoreus TaxID=553468 RepID=A0A1N7DYS1_9EURY|nr:bacterio-opsin activator domain-containing protein [Haladaptatus litoreus]SIR81002.1 PAS domain S-box-containing protein [Haladaptatus litoreus]
MNRNRRSTDSPTGSISVLVVGDPHWRQRLVSGLSDPDETLVTTAVRGHDGYEWLTSQPGEVDCIVCSLDLPDMTGVEFLEVVRAVYPDLPVILVASDGDEAIASRAVAADVTDYIISDGRPTLDDDLFRRIRQAAVQYQVDTTRRRQAHQFEALFNDPETFTWVVAPNGRLLRTNRTALDFLDTTPNSFTGMSFADSPWWADSDTTAEEIRDALRTAKQSDVTRFETELRNSDGRVELDLSFRPVTNRDGAVVSIVVEGTDVTQRAHLERELRESEELHRVTLNNMTDTVLVTNDDGEFTYICPNVHFIFGYSVEELREFGTIDALLGDDLFEREVLEGEGVLTNVECTATDKAGREHTLLVNVRRVSIQGGTTLYSCRDITKRKERERALTALHRTTRDLLYAETEQEIAELVIDDATDIFDREECAIYRFDDVKNELWPAAATDTMSAVHGELPTVGLNEQSSAGRSFIEQTSLPFDDGIVPGDPFASVVNGRDGLFVPLRDHGILIVGDERATLDEVTAEIIDLLAATVEAALDRIEREDELRERDRELQRRNRQLSRLNQTNEIIRDIDQALVQAASREEIEHAVCERLTTDDRFEFAWVGAPDPGTETLRPRAWFGDDGGYLDTVEITSDEPAERAFSTESTAAVPNVADDLQGEPWRREALSSGFQCVIAVPLVHDGVVYGVLAVYAGQPNAFDQRGQTVLSELGETIASAIRSVERKHALLSDSVTELEYRIRDSNCVLRTLARKAGCSLELKGGVRETETGVRLLVAVDDGSSEDVVSVADETVAVKSASAVSTNHDAALVQLTISAPFIATKVAEHGATLERFGANGEEATATVFVPSPVTTHTVDDIVSREYPDSELVAQREREHPPTTNRQFRNEFLQTVTDRQLEVVQTAYYSGYFDSPRRSDGKAVASMLDISPAAFYEHSRKVQRKLFETVFDRTISVSNTG